MLVVSNIDLNENLQTTKPAEFLKSSLKGFILNLNNDYRYMKTGYYVSMHAEILGSSVIPSSQSIIDVNRTPILLLKASKARIPTMPYLLTSSVKEIIHNIGFPAAIFAVNPFSCGGPKIARNRSAVYRAVKSQSMNYKFTVCAQPLKGKIVSFKSIFGRCDLSSAFQEISMKIFETFKIPLCRLHVQVIGEKPFLSSLQPLQATEIVQSDVEVICEEIKHLSEQGEPPVG